MKVGYKVLKRCNFLIILKYRYVILFNVWIDYCNVSSELDCFILNPFWVLIILQQNHKQTDGKLTSLGCTLMNHFSHTLKSWRFVSGILHTGYATSFACISPIYEFLCRRVKKIHREKTDGKQLALIVYCNFQEGPHIIICIFWPQSLPLITLFG